MNLKTLSLAVIVLALLAGAAAFFNRPTPPPDADPRVDQALLDASTANGTTELSLTQNSNTVTLRHDASTDTWRVSSYHDLPANVTKLRTFVQSLTDAKIQRVVTRNPERAARLELDTASIELTTTDGSTWSVDLGKNAERGGRYLRFDDAPDAPAYLADFSGYLDTTAKNWADTKLTSLDRDDIATMTITFADEAPITLTRESATADWTAADLPGDQQVKVGAISSLLSAATNLRFTAVTAPDVPDAIEAGANSRTLTFTTFDGETLTLNLGRRPEKTVVKAPEPTNPADLVTEATTATAPESADEVLENLTETLPAGPTYATVTGPATLAPLASYQSTLAFQIGDYTYTSLPATHEALLESNPE
ncbi:DUF4340 domain-containing protein [Actomonas aquatica]|uniref:DUF4340 domain-containing protein n=1 Tax=Actomonas aquatica TaxID=2866162 RepID=A0ABZ1CCT5_9BACT|nr:DUF4340 domain-containing protein [Opitutus sp. WL0086]WRQ89470.1 DUF4340 domain-containing protein [Opitutus sp. WL0086]